MRKRAFYFFILFCLALPSAFTQEARLLKAEKAMQFLQYPEAIRLYEEYLAKSNDQDVVLALAVAYRKNHEYERAAATFARVEDWSVVSPEYLLQYGRVLIHAASCEEAQPVFDAYLDRRPYDTRVAKFRDVCSTLEKMRTKEEGMVEVFSLGFNTTFNEMAPGLYGSGLVFASDRMASKGAFWDLFISSNPLSTEAPVPFSPVINTKRHEATATFSADSTQIYFTRSSSYATLTDDRRIVPLEILNATRNADGSWSEPQPVALTKPPFSAAHPCLSRDGKRLFFSSDQPGGYGGKDIYFSTWTGSTWGPPVNLGPTINTEGDELFPFFGNDNRLYFSSDGHLGLGGLDIFFADVAEDGESIRIENLGVPFNSADNDFAIVFTPDGRSGYFSSDRSGGAGGDDIYGFQRLFQLLELKILQEDGKTPVAEATVQGDCDIRDGRLLRLPLQSCCFLEVAAPGFETRFIQICGNDSTLALNTVFPITLESPKQTILQGVVLDKASNSPLSGASIHLIENAQQMVTIVSATDGSFSVILPASHCFTVRVEKGDYFTHTLEQPLCTGAEKNILHLSLSLQPFRKIAPAATPTRDTASSPLPERKEEVTFRLQIYYDQFSAEIRTDAVPEMQRLLRILQDNPGIKVEISAHTDSRGDRDSNQRLSQKRAEGVVNWLIQRGISRKQLIAKGYGESRPIKPCPDSKSCSDQDHQLNRRTEFRVIGHSD
jgi:outer membrane protein OmpA-like peptidoglycan-associated protein